MCRYQGTDEASRVEYPETNISNWVDKACLPDLNYRAPEYIMSGSGEVSMMLLWKTCAAVAYLPALMAPMPPALMSIMRGQRYR